jgi:uncharacterized membrane protein
MRPASLQLIASASLIMLIFLCLLWESVLAPIKPGGSALMLKTLPLLLPLFGILRGRIYTYQWTSLMVLAYFCEGVVRAWSETGTGRALALIEIALSLTLFAAAIFYVWTSRRQAR